MQTTDSYKQKAHIQNLYANNINAHHYRGRTLRINNAHIFVGTKDKERENTEADREGNQIGGNEISAEGSLQISQIIEVEREGNQIGGNEISAEGSLQIRKPSWQFSVGNTHRSNAARQSEIQIGMVYDDDDSIDSSMLGSIAIGTNSGMIGTPIGAIAMGMNSGKDNQGSYATAIGFNAGKTKQQKGSIAIGAYAGSSSQQSGAIAIGYAAGRNEQHKNSIVISADSNNTLTELVNDTDLETKSVGENTCVIKPIRSKSEYKNAGNNETNLVQLYYNPTTGELVYEN